MFRAAPWLLLAAALGAAAPQARADVYRWVDDAGMTHFATSKDAIPSRYRDGATAIHEAPEGVTNPSSSHPPPRRTPPPQQPAQAPALKSPPEAAPEAAPAPAPSSTPSAGPTPPPAEGARAPELPVQSPAVAPLAPATPQSDAARPAARGARTRDDPRLDEIADLEEQIERDRETLRQLISAPRWDSAELAADPRVREIAERLPRLQAELAALRSEAAH